MQEKGRKGSRPEPLSASELRHFSKYAKIPRGESAGSEARATFSSGDHARPATENDAIQPRESESHIHQDRAPRSGTSVMNTASLDNSDVGDPYRNLSSTEKCLLRATKSNVQDSASQMQPVQSGFEGDDSALFIFD